MIDILSVEETLRPRLGTRLAETPAIAEPLCGLLRDYASYRASFAELAAQLEDALFNLLYDQLGSGMTVRMDDGSTRRIRTSELREIADDLMGVLFENLKVYSVTFHSLHEYAMKAGSLSAMRILYTRYAEFMTEPEREIIARVLRDRACG